MTIELWMLLAAAALHWGLILGTALPRILGNGIGWAAGNREESPEPRGWVGRCSRCSANLLENLPIFTILVLVNHLSGSADQLTAAGAVTFVVARVAHAGIYIAGIPTVRTLAWAVSIVGWGLMVAGILG